MARVIWTANALANLESIRRYIAEFNPSAAARLGLRLVEAGESLATFPDRGKPVGDGIREIVPISPYILQYEVLGDAVSILRIRHGMMRP